jgi:Bacterial Ig domain
MLHRLMPVVSCWIAGILLFLAASDRIFAENHDHQSEYDDCDANFIAFLGSDAFQFSPRHVGELGRVRLHAVLSFQKAAALGDWGRVGWLLEIRGPVAAGERASLVRTFEGKGRIEAAGQQRVEAFWDGRDERGRLVADGRYEYTFLGRFLADRQATGVVATRYDELKTPAVVEAYASVDSLIVDQALPLERAQSLRSSLAATLCEQQQNTPLEAGFGYNFYYGSTHSHSNYSDGGHPTTACSSGNAYGSGTLDPAGVFDFAKNSAGLDYWLVNEHNHLIEDGISTNDPPLTEAKVKQRYAAGLAAADAATVNDSFVGLYGMEWGVSTNSDQGHVTLIETPKLLGWETCSTCNGPNAECTAGTNCYFDVFSPKRYGYLTLYKRSVENPSPAGALGIFCHPGSGNFDNYAWNADADNAIQGIAVRSGLAFNTADNCANANVASTDYSARWRAALNLGFHIGPVADHDTHCNNYGVGLPNRTVYLLPNAGSPVLTKLALLQAHKARHFFAAEDSNAQLVFTNSAGTQVMGDSWSAAGSATLRAAVNDPNGESVQTLEIWRGQIGGGVPTTARATVSNNSTLTITDNFTSGTYYYYVHAIQADGHDLWSAPMWITYTPGGCADTTPPTVTITDPGAGATINCANTTVQVQAADAAGIASVQVAIDGGAWNNASFNSATSRWEYLWSSASASNGSHSLQARAIDASCGANSATSSAVNVTVNTVCGLNIGGWRLSQANSTLNYTIPAGTTIPPNGYVVIGRNATKAAFETFWGLTLPAGVVYLNSGDTMPQINGSETYTLYNAANTKIDGATIAMPSAAGRTLQRKNPCTSAGTSSNWDNLAPSSANPGSGAGAGCVKGMVINEFADASGTGNFVYEFVELHWDQ